MRLNHSSVGNLVSTGSYAQNYQYYFSSCCSLLFVAFMLLRLSLLNLLWTFCFPVEGRGSYKSLVEAGIKKECFRKYFSLFYNHFGVDPCRTTWPEMMCCERRDSRANATDVFIKDQSLSIITLSKNGEYRLLVKEFNQVDWIVLQK